MSTTPVTYLDMPRVQERARKAYNHSPSISGYGNKLPTTWMLRIDGRWHRVWAIRHSNAASFYVLIRGQRYFMRDGDL